MAALQDAMRRIKRETERSVRFQLKSYRENIKYQYFIKLIDAVSAHMQKMLEERFDDVESVLSKRHCRVWRARAMPSVPAAPEPEPYRYEVAGQVLEGVSWPGLFAHGHLDPATEALLTTLAGWPRCSSDQASRLPARPWPTMRVSKRLTARWRRSPPAACATRATAR